MKKRKRNTKSMMKNVELMGHQNILQYLLLLVLMLSKINGGGKLVYITPAISSVVDH